MSETRKYIICQSLIGAIYIVSQSQKIVAVHMGEDDFKKDENQETIEFDPQDTLLLTAKAQLEEYFLNKRTTFDLPVEKNGTPFQMSVWEVLNDIPYGETRSYQEIAQAIGNAKAVRAIGQANKANRLPILVPCHRVIGKNQSLTGYAGKRTDIKEELLLLEGAHFRK
ncbi:methylated-DNA--[protein]-cysteine S-methyltransferase [Bacillus dakarensis]|uniref:methylated-DNA--[protein]-cysteine S-methyltransferase n=1 Tax=Robertmurraya dakarensis TaxID=1926278 RepID=UPI00098176D6|nr:methylated-DNA--[protein]-cysteine S-methyltransferase [Bacillus dakarensis]